MVDVMNQACLWIDRPEQGAQLLSRFEGIHEPGHAFRFSHERILMPELKLLDEVFLPGSIQVFRMVHTKRHHIPSAGLEKPHLLEENHFGACPRIVIVIYG